MGYAVIDACYWPSSQLGVAAQMLRDYLKDRYDPAGKDGALVSSVHPLDAKKIGRIKRRYPRVYVGGPGALSPGAYETADAVVLGDYRAFVDALPERALELSNIYHPDAPNRVRIDQRFPWGASAHYSGEDGRIQVFCSRGCKHRCKFCQTGWALDYAEHPDPKQIINLPSGKYNYISNALDDLSFWDRLPPGIYGSHHIRNLNPETFTGRVARIGVEGVSERLRRYVAKPITDQELVDKTLSLGEHSISSRWFLIAGLPTETWEDWIDLQECVKAYVVNHRKGTLQLSFTAYCPEPSTPLRDEPYSDDYFEHYQRFADWYFDMARINCLSIFKPQRPGSRAVKATAQMHPGNKMVLYARRGGDCGENQPDRETDSGM